MGVWIALRGAWLAGATPVSGQVELHVGGRAVNEHAVHGDQWSRGG